MSDSTPSIIEPKLVELLRFVQELEQCTSVPYEQFILDFRNTRTAERDLELVIELASDIVNHMLIQRQLPPPQSYRDAFVRAGGADIIDAALADKLVQLSSLRNRIVHEYDAEYDPRRAYEGFKAAPAIVRAFAQTITHSEIA